MTKINIDITVDYIDFNDFNLIFQNNLDLMGLNLNLNACG